MKQYTIEELNTVGTEIDFEGKRLLYTTHHGGWVNAAFSEKNLRITQNIKEHDNKQCIVFDIRDNAINPFLISLDELRKHNLIKEENLENQEIEVGDTVQIVSDENNLSKRKIGESYVVAQINSQYGNSYIREFVNETTGVREDSVKLVKKGNKNMNKEIIGYKLKDQKHNKAAAKIDGYISFGNGNAHEIELLLKDSDHNKTIQKFKDIDLLDLWFTPIYTKTKEIVKLNSDSGTFELEVSKEGIYYASENTWLNIEILQQIICPKVLQMTNLYHKGKNYNYSCTQIIEFVSIGCKHNIPVDGIENALKIYNKLKNE